jgi:hypothetical protein
MHSLRIYQITILILFKMKKLVFAVAIVAVLGGAGLTSFQRSHANNQMSKLALENIDALADVETVSSCRWRIIKDSYGCPYHMCSVDGNGYQCTCGEVAYD